MSESGQSEKAIKDANDAAVAYGPKKFAAVTRTLMDKGYNEPPPGTMTLTQLRVQYSQQKPAVIEGLLREGEVATLVAPSKSGKTWLIYNLIWSVLAGIPFLQEKWKCTQGRVLLFDNELHKPSLAKRLPVIRNDLNLPDTLDDNLRIVSLRGNLKTIKECESILKQNKSWQPTLVVWDALYRMYWEGFQENDNAHMAQLVNLLDGYADLMGAGMVCVHHCAKGNQAEKDIHELGAGGGSLGRAVDTCMGLRAHESKGKYVFESALRDWAETDALMLEWKYPRWSVCEGDTTKLKGQRQQRRLAKEKPKQEDYAVEALVIHITADWMPSSRLASVLEEAKGWTRETCRGVVSTLIAKLGVATLTQSEGVRDCGIVEAQSARNGGLMLRQKPRQP